MHLVKLFLSSNQKKLYLESSWNKQLVELCYSLAGSWDKLSKIWSFSAKPKKAFSILKLLRENQEFSLNCTEDIEELAQKWEKRQEKIKKRNEDLLHVKEHPEEIVTDFSFLKCEPFLFQKSGFAWLNAVDGVGIIGDEMGIGKTFQAISYFAYHKFKTIVICPASLKFNWAKEVEHFTNLKARIISNGDIVEISDDSDIYIVNYEFLLSKQRKGKRGKSTLEQLLVLVQKNKIQCVVIDEAHRMKNQGAKVTKTIHREFKNIPHRILLTGTPIKSRPIEYFSLLKFLDKERWNSKAEFGARYCIPETQNKRNENSYANYQNGRFGVDYSGASNLKELYEETIPYVIRREKKDVLKDLPEKVYTLIPLELPSNIRKEYVKIEGELLDVLEPLDSGEQQQNKTKLPDFSRIHKVRQFTSAYKLNYIKEFLETLIEDPDKKAVVFSQYLAPIYDLHESYKEKSVTYTGKQDISDKDNNLKKFIEDNRCQIFIASIMAAGIGIDGLQHATDTVIFVDQPLTPADLSQAEDRLNRIGSKTTTQVITFMCKDTIDERIYNLQEKKRLIFSQVINNRDYEERVENTSLILDLINEYRREKYGTNTRV